MPLDYAQRLCRKREIVDVLQYMASTASDSEWETFSAKFVQINGSALSAYDELFHEYHASAILKGRRANGDMQETKVIVEAYKCVKEEKQKSFIDRLIDVLASIEVPIEVVGGICSRVIKEHYVIAEFGITQLEQGKAPGETLRILNMYQNDDEFRKVPPEEFSQ